jgi:cytochrome c
MKNLSFIVPALLLCLLFSCQERPRILVFSKTAGYRHASIGVGKKALLELGQEHGFDVDTTEDASVFNEENLRRYNTVIFLSTTGNVLDLQQQGAFRRYIQAGGGFVGVHAASDTEYEWPWFGRLTGAYFKSHPKIQEARIVALKPTFGDDSLQQSVLRTDEWYNYRSIGTDLEVLYNLDEESYQGGINGKDHPIVWYHEFDGGRAFYTGMGHTDESYADPFFRNHLWQGIRYALGEGDKPDFDKATAKVAPDESRFTKTVLDFNLNEPTEMVILPDSRIIFMERKGNVKLYDPKSGKVRVVNTFHVGTKFEDGMLGIAADPDFEKNHWLYIFYSHAEKSANILSRFTFVNDQVDSTSEKVMLEVPTQRESCCHTAGSLAFGPEGNLFLSTGDNTNPWESRGFSPSDERPDRGPYDAQKSASNTNDLRGKVLRIKPQPDGTYTIPAGNLFDDQEPNTRPEIYVMGCRNPYRISVDAKTGALYWGEVGPDAGEGDSLRGPRSYDEINLARRPGNYGWPYFVGKNEAYARYDYATGEIKGWWDPALPINESINNTGKHDLPPATPALIYYPYAHSDEFPMLKEGGRNAMAGPVYHSDLYKGVSTAFPDYFDDKLIAYDWMRNWMFLVSLDGQDKIMDMEPFMPNINFNNIIDMAFGPDGRLYMLEYGTKWFAQNLDARLVRIDYNAGNRAPVAKLKASTINGGVPLQVQFSAAGTFDHDKGDKLTLTLKAAGKDYETKDSLFTVTFDKPGVYPVQLKVVDDKGLESTASVQVAAGNALPEVKASLVSGNKTFFFPGTPVAYVVEATDAEDGSTADGKIDPTAVTVTFDYVKGFDMAQVAQGHQLPTAELPGKALIAKSDCKSCHTIDQRSAGPSYQQVAARYKGNGDAPGQLAAKIIKGGAGVWGGTEMAAHPQLSVDEAKKMVEYILSLADAKAPAKLPLQGKVTPGKETDGVYMLTASYQDKGGAGNVPALSASQVIVLRSAVLMAHEATEVTGAQRRKENDQSVLADVKNNARAAFLHLDLTGIRQAKVTLIVPADQAGGEVALHLDTPDGTLFGKGKTTGKGVQTIGIPATATTGYHDLYLVFKNSGADDQSLFYFRSVQLVN